jgi:glucose/arabinose dehydrogenase
MLVGITSPCDHCTPANQYSGAIVSFLPDGSDLRVYASGIRAPIGLAYYPGTSDLFVTMNQRDDLGDATPGDWLAVVKDGDDWGFPDCYGQSGSACAGVPSPVAELDKHAAVSSVATVTGQLGSSIGDAAVVAEWQSGKVLIVSLDKTAGGYTGTIASAVTGIGNPVAVAVGPDGALYTADWTSGTVYRIVAG